MNIKPVQTVVLIAALAGLVAGCESVRESMRERFAPMQPKVHVFQGESKQVYSAARLAMARLGFEVTRGGPAQGVLEGLTRIGGGGAGGDLYSARQRDMTVRLAALGDGRVEVSVVIDEIEEDRYSKLSNPATSTPLRESAVYDAFFEEVERQLQAVAGK